METNLAYITSPILTEAKRTKSFLFLVWAILVVYFPNMPEVLGLISHTHYKKRKRKKRKREKRGEGEEEKEEEEKLLKEKVRRKSTLERKLKKIFAFYSEINLKQSTWR